MTNDITYVVGKENVHTKALEPYNNIALDFLNKLSSDLRLDAKSLKFPDVMAFAFWCRKTNLMKLKAGFVDEKIRLGVGLVFHIAPSNVPVNFAFSFVFGLLSGNANVVRVPSKKFIQVKLICDYINQIFQNDKYQQIKQMTAFVRYGRDSNHTAIFSEKCNARVIWGGDETIRRIRKLPIPARAVDLTFADRYSICIMDTAYLAKINDQEMKRLVQRFYNDTYLMDQNACSSPHLVLWVGGNDNEPTKEKFWAMLSEFVTNNYYLEAISAVDKYAKLCDDAIKLDCIVKFQQHSNSLYRVALGHLPRNIDTFRGKCGYFYEYDTQDINEVHIIINEKYQTITYFGVDKSKLVDLVVKNRVRGIDRIVPVGMALDIGVIWDGYDIIGSLSRIIDMK